MMRQNGKSEKNGEENEFSTPLCEKNRRLILQNSLGPDIM